MKEQDPIPSRSKKRKDKKNRKNRIKKIMLILSVFALLTVIFSTYMIATAYRDWEDFDPDKLENINQTSFIYDNEGNPITNIYGTQNRISVSLMDIPKHVRDAFVAVEDVRFYEHKGIDIRRIISAIIEDIKARSYVQGASTITQQVIKNSHLSMEKTINRKLQEVYLAWQLENMYSKDQILEMYLNLIYFGKGAYGIEAASQMYFGKSASELSVAEGALLAGVPNRPYRYSPFISEEEALSRKDLVLSLMVRNDFLTEDEGRIAAGEQLKFADETQPEYPYGYFMDIVLSEAAQVLDIREEELYTEGYNIYTTLDTKAQEFAEELYRQDDLFPKSPSTGESCQSALVVLDTSTGEIRAIMGGREYPKGHRKVFNRASQSQLQPGSAIKPLMVYIPAIEQYNYTPISFIEDAPVTYGNYSPTNYGGRYHGIITLRYAVAHSVNIPAVKILREMGIQTGISFIEQVGITVDERDRHNLSVALGGFTTGISPLNLSTAYSALGDRGYYKGHTTIRRIEDAYGIPLYESTPHKKRVMSEETAFLMSDILKSSVEWGTATRLNELNLPLAAKTGTVQLPPTNEFADISGTRDTWITVYNPDYVVTVWMGFDETNKDNYLPPNAVGGSYTCEIAKQMIAHLFSHREARDFDRPAGIVEVKLDAKSLWKQRRVLLASPLTPPEFTTTEYLPQNIVPAEESDYWVIPDAPYNFNVALSDDRVPLISFSTIQTFAGYQIYRLEDGQREATLIHEISPGSTGDIYWYDNQVTAGSTYGYYIVPVHPEILLDNAPAQGTKTEIKSITIPYVFRPEGIQREENVYEIPDSNNIEEDSYDDTNEPEDD